MAVIIKEMRIRTVVEKRVVPEAELPGRNSPEGRRPHIG